MHSAVEVHINDDYASLDVGEWEWYYGYEKVVDQEGKLYDSHEIPDDVDELPLSWAFVVSRDGEPVWWCNPRNDEPFDSCERHLLQGMGLWLDTL